MANEKKTAEVCKIIKLAFPRNKDVFLIFQDPHTLSTESRSPAASGQSAPLSAGLLGAAR